MHRLEANSERKAPMKVALGADHAGFELKERVKALLQELKHEVLDVGTFSTDACAAAGVRGVLRKRWRHIGLRGMRSGAARSLWQLHRAVEPVRGGVVERGARGC